MLHKFQNMLSCMIVVSEISHVFCCVLPTIFSIISLLAGIGIISTMPTGLESVHDLIHDYEIPLIIASGIIISLSWGLYAYSRKIECHEHDDQHKSCDKKKDRTKQILLIGTIIFIINVLIYVGVHRNDMLANYMEAGHAGHSEHSEDHHGHNHEDH